MGEGRQRWRRGRSRERGWAALQSAAGGWMGRRRSPALRQPDWQSRRTADQRTQRTTQRRRRRRRRRSEEQRTAAESHRHHRPLHQHRRCSQPPPSPALHSHPLLLLLLQWPSGASLTPLPLRLSSSHRRSAASQRWRRTRAQPQRTRRTASIAHLLHRLHPAAEGRESETVEVHPLRWTGMVGERASRERQSREGEGQPMWMERMTKDGEEGETGAEGRQGRGGAGGRGQSRRAPDHLRALDVDGAMERQRQRQRQRRHCTALHCTAPLLGRAAMTTLRRATTQPRAPCAAEHLVVALHHLPPPL